MKETEYFVIMNTVMQSINTSIDFIFRKLNRQSFRSVRGDLKGRMVVKKLKTQLKSLHYRPVQ